jgi:hypothetical protein
MLLVCGFVKSASTMHAKNQKSLRFGSREIEY